jgi:hypothetical protein
MPSCRFVFPELRGSYVRLSEHQPFEVILAVAINTEEARSTHDDDHNNQTQERLLGGHHRNVTSLTSMQV